MKFFGIFLFLFLLGVCEPAESTENVDAVEVIGSVETVSELPVSYSCKTHSDCMVMNVGNCCGYYPACVNKTSKPDPEAAAKKCEEQGLSGVCGYTEIKGCQCVDGLCRAD